MQSLWYLLIFAHAVLSGSLSNMEPRDGPASSSSAISAREYVVYPIDPRNTESVNGLEHHLKSRSVDGQVFHEASSVGIHSWVVTLRDESEIQALKEYPGVRDVHPSGASSQTRSLHQKRDDGCKYHMVGLNDPIKQDDKAAIDDMVGFLKKQVDNQDEKEFIAIRLPGQKIGGWSNLLLTENGLKEVEKNEKLRGSHCDSLGTHSAIPKLRKRAPAGWKKQRDQPLGLAEISVPT